MTDFIEYSTGTIRGRAEIMTDKQWYCNMYADAACIARAHARQRIAAWRYNISKWGAAYDCSITECARRVRCKYRVNVKTNLLFIHDFYEVNEGPVILPFKPRR